VMGQTLRWGRFRQASSLTERARSPAHSILHKVESVGGALSRLP